MPPAAHTGGTHLAQARAGGGLHLAQQDTTQPQASSARQRATRRSPQAGTGYEAPERRVEGAHRMVFVVLVNAAGGEEGCVDAARVAAVYQR